jgi:hypothetical protein
MRFHNLNQNNNFKLLANAIFGKSCQNVRDYNNVRLIADPSKLRKSGEQELVQVGEITNDDLTMHGSVAKTKS